MRLSGLPAGIATFAVLGITTNIISYWDEDRPRRDRALARARERRSGRSMVGALIAIVVAFAYQRSRFGRQLRATREDPQAAQAAGIHVHRQRLYAFVHQRRARRASPAACSCTSSGSITTDQVYLELTFTTLAMLVVGGVSSLWGAVLGALLISGAQLVPRRRRAGHPHRLPARRCPTGTRLVTIGAVMALVLILRPSGLTGGREFSLPARSGAPEGSWRPSKRAAFDELRLRMAELNDLQHVGGLLDWDQQAMMPPAGGAVRARAARDAQSGSPTSGSSSEVRATCSRSSRRTRSRSTTTPTRRA